MKIYYEILKVKTEEHELQLNLYAYKEARVPVFKIPCDEGDNLLLTIEDYLFEKTINFKITELIPL